MDNDESFAPFRLFETTTPSRFELVLFDGDMEQVEEVFHRLDAEANGHGWQELAESVVAMRLPATSERVVFDSEGGTFVALSTDITALRQLAAVLHHAFHDCSHLEELIVEMNQNAASG